MLFLSFFLQIKAYLRCTSLKKKMMERLVFLLLKLICLILFVLWLFIKIPERKRMPISPSWRISILNMVNVSLLFLRTVLLVHFRVRGKKEDILEGSMSLLYMRREVNNENTYCFKSTILTFIDLLTKDIFLS